MTRYDTKLSRFIRKVRDVLETPHNVSHVYQREQSFERGTHNSAITLQINITNVRIKMEMLNDFMTRKSRQCR